jgi:hypothetical protein
MNKDFIFLILLLVIVFGVLFWQNPETTDFYFDKIKAVMAPKLELSEDSGLDLSDVNIESFFEDDGKKEESAFTLDGITLGEDEEDGIGGPLIGEMLEDQAVEKEIVVLGKKLTLEEIKQEVNRVAEEVERIDKEVQILVALDKTQ